MPDDYKLTPPPDEPPAGKTEPQQSPRTDTTQAQPTQPPQPTPPPYAQQPPGAYQPQPGAYESGGYPPGTYPFSYAPPGYPPPGYPPQPVFAAPSSLPPVAVGPRKSRAWLWVLIGGSAFFLFVLAIFTLIYISVRTDTNASNRALAFGDKIAVVDVEGVIISPEETVKELKKYGDDDSIKAIILHLNTPGGGAAASEEMYREVRRIRDEKKKKIVASIETVGASGGYYVASATDKIYANEASIVGSIGVIAEWVNYGDLMHWAKLKDMTLKAGEFKDTGSPTRDLTPAEREYMQGMLDNMHQQFIKNVADGRKMKYDDVKAIANGKVWTGQQALPLHLIDEIGDFQKCVKETAKSVGINGEPTLVRPEREKKSVLDLLIGDASEYLPSKAKMLQTHPGFYFLWK
jgi:protease-4